MIWNYIDNPSLFILSHKDRIDLVIELSVLFSKIDSNNYSKVKELYDLLCSNLNQNLEVSK